MYIERNISYATGSFWLFLKTHIPSRRHRKQINKYIYIYHHHQCFLPRGRSFTASAATKAAVLPKACLPLQTQEPRLQLYQGLNRCSSFLLLSAPHSLFSIWTDLRRSPGAPKWRWGEWIWLTGPSRLHRNYPQGLNICSIRVFNQIKDAEIPITLRLHIYLLPYVFSNRLDHL